jgi:RNA polymerase-binding transcription factor DksA
VDAIQHASERALASCHRDRASNQRRNARAALRRLHEGSFGVCQPCEEDIDPNWRVAIPWAPRGMQGQDAIDRNREAMQTPTDNLLGNAA